MENDHQIDIFKYGQLVATVDSLEKKIDKLEKSVEQLCELANKSKGGMWAGTMVVSAFSSLVGFISHYLMSKPN
jgi:hypothetical protein